VDRHPPTDLDLTIDQLADATGTTTRRLRALQTLGLLPPPELRGRTGRYGPAHRTRVQAVLDLQRQGFSLESLRVLFDALDRGRSLASVLGADRPPPATGDADDYGFPALRPARPGPTLLSLVPTTVWDEGMAS
jgi:DNA-binding transcriptional MerR regulator